MGREIEEMPEGHAKPGEPGWNDPTARLPRRERLGYEKLSTVSIVSSAGASMEAQTPS
ncbi:MAG TPA: hypothetical protein VN937_10015 [Blastocatellia bacterium]|nr:hypothetical protein [Blastocatellia bacterium]